MERLLGFQQHVPPPPPPPPSRSSSAYTNGIPPRGAFSAHMLLQEPTSVLGSPMSRSSAPPSVLSSPRSGFEYSPDHHQHHQTSPEPVKRSPVKRQSRGFGLTPSLSPSSSPLPPPTSRLHPARVGSSASVVHPMRRPTATQVHHAEPGNNNIPGTSTNRMRAQPSPQVSPRGRKVLNPGIQQQQQQHQVRTGIKGIVPGMESPIGINISTNNQIGNEVEYQEDRFVLAPTPSVHPIDTLAKKLRQQALELTGVYEQLEKKTQRLKNQENQIQELQFQLEKLKSVKQQSNNVSSSKTTTVAGANRRVSSASSGSKSNNGTRQSGAGGSKPSVGSAGSTSAATAAKKIDELQRQVKDLEDEKKQHELSTKRIENAIADLKLHQSGRLQQQLVVGVEGDSDPKNLQSAATPEMLLQGQQLYIRVLEEAVHLKASELHVTGHEELLMVLAELRHTIYQQEQDVADKQRQVDEMKTQLLKQREKQLTQSQQLDEKSTKRELEIYELRQEKSTLASQLDQVQRQLQRENEQNRRMQASTKEFKEREAHLNEKLTSTVQLKKLAESKVDKLTRSLQETQANLAQVTSKHEHEAQKSSRLSDDFAKKAAQFEELKVLQDELLCRIDSYAMQSENATLEKDNLEIQLQSALTKEQNKVKQLQDLVSAKEDDSQHLSVRLEAAELLVSDTQELLNTVSKRKLALEKQMEDERLQMEKALDEQSLVLNQKQRTIDTSEKLWNEMQEILKKLDEAIHASLEIMRMDPSSQENDENKPDNVDIVDFSNETPVALNELKLCMRSLSHLMASESVCDRQLQSHLPSFRDLLQRVHRVMVSLVEDSVKDHGSWTRERSDLRKASDELHATAQICEVEMRKVHNTHLQTCEQLEKVCVELTARKHESVRLKSILQERKSEIESLRAFEQQVVEQNRAIVDQELQIEELTDKLQACKASETKQRAALEEKKQLINQLHKELLEVNERTMHLKLAESALENAVELAEQQNTRSEEDLEGVKCDQEDTLKALKTKEKAFSDRFCGLFRQYCGHLRSSSSALNPRNKGMGRRDADAELIQRLDMYESEAQRGEVVRMVQIFPTLLEDFITCSGDGKPSEFEFDEATKPQKPLIERMSHFQGDPVKPKGRSNRKSSPEVNNPSCFAPRVQLPTPSPSPPPAAASYVPAQNLPFHGYAEKKSSNSVSESLNKRSLAAANKEPQPTSDRELQCPHRIHHHGHEEPQQHSKSFNRAAHQKPQKSTKQHAEDASFQEQLALIHDAFQTFKAPQQRSFLKQ